MRPIIQEIVTSTTPELLCQQLRGLGGVVLLRTARFEDERARYSFVTARPMLTFKSYGSRCEVGRPQQISEVQFGNPWSLLDVLMSRFEILDKVDMPFPLGGCFGYWGYGLKNFVEPRLSRFAVDDLDLPDCEVGFYDSLVVFDHRLNRTWIVSTGLAADGSRTRGVAESRIDWWRQLISASESGTLVFEEANPCNGVSSNLSRDQFIDLVLRAQRYIQGGDIYQVNLAQRLHAPLQTSAWNCYLRLANVSPAPFAAYLECDGFQIISSSPELFLRLSGSHIQTRPIKGTRPRSADPIRDAQLSFELQTSAKEMAELVMITDLLRNDLGRICAYGSVHVPELMRLERFSQVQHLVSTVEGQLPPDVTHFSAFASCFPGGSVTGAPKIRAMEIIDELEPLTRGPYTGSIGYLGFNRESQLNIAIRTAIVRRDDMYFYAGAGIVAESEPNAEYEETMAKAGGFMAALTADRAKYKVGDT